MSRGTSSRKRRRRKFFSGLIIVFLSVIIFTQIKGKLFATVGDSTGDYALVDENSLAKKDKSNPEDAIETIDEKGNGDSNFEDRDGEIKRAIEEKKQVLIDTVYVNNEGQRIVTNPDDILVLVNKERILESDYKPNDLVIPDVPFTFEGNDQKRYLRKVAAEALEELFKEGEKEGVVLHAASGYRSYERQEFLFNYRAERNGVEETNKLTARPGQSEHQTGLAMDVTSESVNFSLNEKFEQTVEGIWLRENAHRFGFILRFLKEKTDITGYSYEPWHIRYIGEDVAADIYGKSITLEEYFGFEYGMEY
ncbi:MAG: M15 family metallopeptidase [Tissierellales bacterium]